MRFWTDDDLCISVSYAWRDLRSGTWHAYDGTWSLERRYARLRTIVQSTPWPRYTFFSVRMVR